MSRYFLLLFGLIQVAIPVRGSSDHSDLEGRLRPLVEAAPAGSCGTFGEWLKENDFLGRFEKLQSTLRERVRRKEISEASMEARLGGWIAAGERFRSVASLSPSDGWIMSSSDKQAVAAAKEALERAMKGQGDEEAVKALYLECLHPRK